MPGFRHCPWCNGKGCICCAAEQAKHEKAEAERRTAEKIDRAKRVEMTEARRTAQLADPAYQEWAINRIRPEEARPFLWDGGGFRYCPACDGAGCKTCPESERGFLLGAIANAIWWKQDRLDVRDLRDAVVRTEAGRREAGEPRSLSEDQIEAALKPALDAEYARQFPDGPQPIFTARRDNPVDMALLKKVFGPEKLAEAFGPGGEGMAEIERNAEAAQRAKVLLCNQGSSR